MIVENSSLKVKDNVNRVVSLAVFWGLQISV